MCSHKRFLVFPLAEDFINAVVFDIGEQVLDFVHAFQRHTQFGQRDQRNLSGSFKSLDAAEAYVTPLDQLFESAERRSLC